MYMCPTQVEWLTRPESKSEFSEHNARETEFQQSEMNKIRRDARGPREKWESDHHDGARWARCCQALSCLGLPIILRSDFHFYFHFLKNETDLAEFHHLLMFTHESVAEAGLVPRFVQLQSFFLFLFLKPHYALDWSQLKILQGQDR